MKIYVSDLREGMEFFGVFQVVKKELRPFVEKEGNYLYLQLKDKTGVVDAICWEVEGAPQFDEDDIIAFDGKVDVWRGDLRLIINPASLVKVSFDEVDIKDFIPSTEKDVNSMVDELFGFINKVENVDLQRLLRIVFEDKEFLESFKNAPAAISHHHNYLGGLLEHTVSVAKLCEALSSFYPELNKDLLITGALLHDIGKVREYKWIPKIDITTEGGFAGHPALGAHMIAKKFPQDFPEDLKIKVYHMILSHHGEGELGAVVPPKFSEAYALHLAENLDAQLKEFMTFEKKGRNKKEKGKIWDYARSFGRFVYIGEEEKEEKKNDDKSINDR